MMIKNKLKSGFTLVELMIFFVFITLLIAASTPLITKKVKDLPLRVYHGKFVCYMDENGGLVQELYNTSGYVSGGAVTECTFTPPKNASLYRIEMIGAGAGGYDYYSDRGRDNTTKQAKYVSGKGSLCPYWGGCEANTHIVPTNQQFKQYFQGAEYRKAVRVQSAQNGQGIALPSYVAMNINRLNWEFTSDYKELAEYANLYYNNLDFEGARKYQSEHSDTLTTDMINDYKNRNASFASALGMWTHRLATIHAYSAYSGNSSDLSSNNPYFDLVYSDYFRDIFNSFYKVTETVEKEDGTNDTVVKYYKKLSTIKPLGDNYNDNNVELYGGYGGNGGYLVYNGYLDFNQYSSSNGGVVASPIDMSGVVSYLQNMGNNKIQTVYLEAPATGGICGSSKSAPSNSSLSNKEVTAEELEANKDQEIKAEDGEDGLFVGLSLWNNTRCASILTQAEGGEGAAVEYGIDTNSVVDNGMAPEGDADQRYLVKKTRVSSGSENPVFGPKNGKSASGVAAAGGNTDQESIEVGVGIGYDTVYFTTSSVLDANPTLYIDTTLQDITYKLGYNGSAGNYKTFWATSLDGDCTFEVPEGGEVVDKNTIGNLANMEAKLQTTISCNNDSIVYSVSGGSYNTGTKSITHSQFENMGKYIDWLKANPNGTPPKYSSTFKINEEDEWASDTSKMSKSKYKSANNIFSRYTLNGDYGAGGTAPYIVDHCMTPQGYYNASMARINGTTVNVYGETFKELECDPETDIEIHEAQPGKGGAIIISW